MKFLRFAIAGLIGLGIWVALTQGRPYVVVASTKLNGAAQACSWEQSFAVPNSTAKFNELRRQLQTAVVVDRMDEKAGLEQISTPGRSFWVAAKGEDMSGPALIAYLLAEHQWINESNSPYLVRPGDVVVDVGAHVGVFSALALKRGASKVIQIEPNPQNIEALHRNFEHEIAAGKVIVIPEGAWSSTSTLDLHIGPENSGTSSLVLDRGGKQVVRVPVRPLDDMLRERGITRVDFIKMDIEGAEREALKGAAETLKNSKPRLMLDSYHLPDDQVVLPQVVKTIRGDYQVESGPCEYIPEGTPRIIPHVVFYY